MPPAGQDQETAWLVTVSAGLVALGPATRFADYLRQRSLPEVEEPAWWARMLDLSTEANLPTWWASTLLVALAGLFLVAASLHRAAARPAAPYQVMAGIAVLLSIDEAVALHEQVLGEVGDGLVDAEGLLHFTWIVPGAVLSVVVGLVVLRASVALPAPVRRGLALGGGLFLTGALGVEALSGAVFDSRGHDRVYLVVTSLEEGLELAGVLLSITAARRLIAVRVAPAVDDQGAGGRAGTAQRGPAIEIGIRSSSAA